MHYYVRMEEYYLLIKIASFSPLKRNGELLIANSIEAIEKANLREMKYGAVEQKYLDPRKEILATTYDSDNVLLQRKILRIIDSVRYTKWLDEGKDKESFEKTRLGYYNAIFCGEDWYVIYSYYGLQYECLDDDPRAKKEMEATISVINEHIRNKNDIRKLVLAYNNKKG